MIPKCIKQKQLENRVEQLEKDTGWIKVTLESGFQAYNGDTFNIPKYRKVGNIVEISGAVAVTNEIAAGQTVTIFRLPEGYRPSVDRLYVCQGSNRDIWLLIIRTTGEVDFSRYGTSSFVATPTSAWLPFNAMFFVG